jgi:hypothetical protein
MELLKRVRNDFKHHPPKDEDTVAAHEQVRSVLHLTANELIGLCPESRELSLALTKLEEAMFWANAAIARVE